MRLYHQFLIITIILAAASCRTVKPGYGLKDDGKLEVTFVQVNDVYEIAPLSGGKEGGMARVATLKKQYLKENPNTFLVMAGDFISPSVYNSLPYQGKRIRGRQMIEAMNAAGMDIAVFGNHEFDFGEADLQDRINESNFKWVASNTFHKTQGQVVPFAKVTSTGTQPFPKTYIMSLRDKDGTTAKVGFIGLTLPANKAVYVSYDPALSTAKQLYNQLKDSCDAVVAITHQFMEEDVTMAKEIPQLAAILGGHEHSMRFDSIGKLYITKAHANARSAYIVKLLIDKKNHRVSVNTPQLKYLNESTPLDSSTNLVVEKWSKIAADNYASLGFDPKKVLIASGDSLEGREEEVRYKPTNLTRLITNAIADACPQAEVVIMNSGSIRVDDILYPPVTQYDFLRSLPFGGGLREVDMKGSLLIQVLETGRKNSGNGGFLQYQPVTYQNNTWTINNAPIDPARVYHVALNDFLLTGGESNMDYLNERNSGIVKVYPAETNVGNPKSDIRLAIVKYLEKGGNQSR